MSDDTVTCSEDGCALIARWLVRRPANTAVRPMCSAHAAGALTVDHTLLMTPRRAA